MSDLKTQINTNKRLIVIGIAVLMFLFFAICSAMSTPLIGFSGFGMFSKLLSISGMPGLGFARFLTVLMIIVPIVIVVDEFINFKANLPAKLKENFGTCMFGLGVVLAIIFAIALPTGASLGWGGILYIILGLAGVVVNNTEKILK